MLVQIWSVEVIGVCTDDMIFCRWNVFMQVIFRADDFFTCNKTPGPAEGTGR